MRRRGIPALGSVTGPADIAPEVPVGCEESVTEEIAMALGMSKPATDKLVNLAIALATRLTATAALDSGEVDYVKASVMADVTGPLANEAAWHAEKLALMQADGSFAGKTPGELRKLIERASIAADPDAAEKRRTESERNARVASWRETEGTMAIQACGLNPADAMDAEAAIQERAEAYRKAGMTGGMDRLRTQAFTDKLTGMNPLGDDAPATRAAPKRVHLTAPEWILPLLTVLGLADNPGEAAGLGAIDPAMVRQLATATATAAGNQTEFHLSLVNDQGWVTTHGCPPPDPRSNRAKAGNAGTVRISLPAGQARDFTLYPVALFDCDHRYRTAQHDPSGLLRHLTEVRDGTCARPGCARPAAKCDYEHAQPFEEGGITCMCNGAMVDEHDHQIKQKNNWHVRQIAPAFREWTTPSGRSYASQPRQYPS
ncbi:MAG: DUF222 domain-containing protein [Streptosporangiaceae bacterium]|nr:DUF222 domain-containing protein [Streptosporangiaceae bacterium]